MAEYYTPPPQSRDEAIIVATLNDTEYTAEPESRIEDLLIQLKEAIESGGGSGTVTSVSVQGGSGSHLTGSGNPVESSGTITINVDEGYSIPSDNRQNAWDIKAADLKFEINSSTFVITAQLKDSSGNLIGHERTIDLPLESVVVNGAYDDQTKKVILTLQNGNTIEFSVADLVSGLQTELNDTDNKLNPDFIEYDSTHRVVTDEEKAAWNGKQDALNETQLAAVNSGIDSDDVTQISTNQTNISSVEDMVCDNEFDTTTAYAVGDYVTHENGLYEFTSAHSAGAWNSNEVTEISLIDVLGNINTVLEAVL